MNAEELYLKAGEALRVEAERDLTRKYMAHLALDYMKERVMPAVGRELWGRPDTSFYLSTDLHHWYDTPWGSATLSVTMKNGDSWGEVGPVLEELQVAGFSLEGWQTHDDAVNFARTFTQTVEVQKDNSTESSVTVSITMALREGNTGGCRRVFVGKKFETHTSERDEYKLVCDETTEA